MGAFVKRIVLETYLEYKGSFTAIPDWHMPFVNGRLFVAGLEHSPFNLTLTTF
jgi:hypothetical protein